MKVDQERIVLILAASLFVFCSIFLPKFASLGNLLQLLRDVSVLGILALGMGIVVIGRGIDLSMVATMAMSVALTFTIAGDGDPVLIAVAAGFLFALAMGLIVGFLVAYIEIPALFATLAMAAFIYGVGKMLFAGSDSIYMPSDFGSLANIGSAKSLGVPNPVLLFILLSACVAILLSKTRYGRFFYAIGDNILSARITGIPVRPLLVLQYALSALLAYAAGIVMGTSTGLMSTKITQSNLIYEVILVVVLGGIGLSGGRGRVRNIIVGTVFIGIFINAMTIIGFSDMIQNIVKSMLLLIAISVDGFINPRNEQTAQQGDI